MRDSSTSCSMTRDALSVDVEVKEPKIKCRYIVILFAFWGEFFHFALIITMGVNIVAMVDHSALPEDQTATSESCLELAANVSNSTEHFEKMEGKFQWSPELQGYILGCSFLCYALATAFTGKLTELFGSKNVLFWGFFLSSLFTFISPFAAWCNVYVLIVVQSLRGLFQASVVPAESALIANWCPISERGLSFTIVLSGSCWGAVLGSYVSGLLCEASFLGGWPISFFFFGGSGLIVSSLMGLFMYDNPSVHPKISPAELKYISENQEKVLTKERPVTPWRSLLTSVPVYALAYAYFGQMWALAHFLTAHPTFLGTILHYPIEENGLFSALPFLLQFLVTIGSGWLSTFLSSKNFMSVDTSRKFWNFLSCLGYSVCLMGIYFAGCNRYTTIIFAILSLAFTGFGYAGCWITSVDMSPSFAASVNAVSCTLGMTSNFIMPVVVGSLTDGQQTIEQWNKILLISIAVVMSSGVVFALFGSARIQSWNDGGQYDEEKIKPIPPS